MSDAAWGRDLRVGLFPSFFYRKSPAGLLEGVAVELATAVAARAGRPLALTEHPAPPDVVRALAAGTCDVAFLGIDPARAADVDYSPPLMRAEFTFLVPARSAVHSIADADGCRIALVRHHAMDTALRGQLPHAERVYAATPDDAFALLQAGGADLLAGIRPGLLACASRLTGARVLPDAYGANILALAVAKNHVERLAFVSGFARDALGSGLVHEAIATAGLAGIDVMDGKT